MNLDCGEVDYHEVPAMESRKDNRAAVLTVIGGFILELYLGCFFLWSNISIYVLSDFYRTDKDLSYSFIFLVDTFLVLFNWVGYQVGAYLF